MLSNIYKYDTADSSGKLYFRNEGVGNYKLKSSLRDSTKIILLNLLYDCVTDCIINATL